MIIRTTKLKITFANKNKFKALFGILNDDIKRQCNNLIETLLYQPDDLKKFAGKELYQHINHPSSHIRNVVALEALKTAKSIRNKLKKIKPDSNLQKYQQELLDKFNSKELKINWDGNLQLDQCTFKIEKSHTSTKFDYWIKLKWKGQDRFYIPFRSNNHFRNLIKRGFTFKQTALKICKGGYVIFTFEKYHNQNTNNKSIGIDIGRNKAFVCSDGVNENKSKDILNTLNNMKHGGKNKRSRIRQLKQIIDSEIKNIRFNELNTVILEDLTGIKTEKKWGNINHHWPVSYIRNRIQLHCEEQNVSVIQVNPAYTSQDCSSCGYRHKNNRIKEKFLCLSCEYETDADYNASLNIHKRGTKNVRDQRT